MHIRHDIIDGGREPGRGKTSDAEHLLRPGIAPGGHVQLPASDPCHFLRPVKTGLTLEQRGLRVLQRTDVDAYSDDAAVAHPSFCYSHPTAVRTPPLERRTRLEVLL